MRQKLIKILGAGLIIFSCSHAPRITGHLDLLKNPKIRTSFVRACEIKYAYDTIEYGGEYWQTPEETEKKRKGDCEDKSIYLYHLLKKEGIKSQVIFGYIRKSDIEDGMGHAWIEYKEKNTTYILDPTRFFIKKRRNLGTSRFIPSINFWESYNEFQKRSGIKGMNNCYDNLKAKDFNSLKDLLNSK